MHIKNPFSWFEHLQSPFLKGFDLLELVELLPVVRQNAELTESVGATSKNPEVAADDDAEVPAARYQACFDTWVKTFHTGFRLETTLVN